MAASLQAFAGAIMAGAVSFVVLLALLAFMQCTPGRIFLFGAPIVLMGAALGGVLALRSGENRIGWVAMAATFLMVAGLFVWLSFIETEPTCKSVSLF